MRVTTRRRRGPEPVAEIAGASAEAPAPLADEPPEQAELLIEEARRRRRWGFSLLVLAAAGALIGGLVSSSGSPPPPTSPKTTPSSLPRPARTTTGPTTPPAGPTVPTSSPSLTLLYSSASPLRGVIGVAPGGPGTGISSLYVTHDFRTYSRVSLPVLPTSIRAVFSFVSSVSFATARAGWAVVNAPGSGVYLFETTDAGELWHYVREIHSEANGAYGWVRFVSATVGWAGAGDVGSNGPSTLLRTTDGGRIWETLPGVPSIGSWATPSFVTSTVGFLRGTVGSGGSTRLLMTTDGGSAWNPVAVPVARGRSGTVFPALPEVSGTAGVLPFFVGPTPSELTAGEQPTVTVGFDTTTDGDRSWVAGPSLIATAVTGFSTVRSTVGWIAAGPAAAVATPSDWWVLSPGKAGRIAIRATHDAGMTWTNEAGTGLPTIHVPSLLDHQVSTPIVLQAITGQIAVVVVQTSPSEWSTYVTTDGGSTWSLLTPATVKTLPSTEELVTPTVKVSPWKKLVDGEKVKVDIAGFGKEGRYRISECLADTDVTEAGCGRGLTAQPVIVTGPSGRGSATFAVSSSAAPSANTRTAERRCARRCVLVVSGGLGHGLAYAPLTFKP